MCIRDSIRRVLVLGNLEPGLLEGGFQEGVGAAAHREGDRLQRLTELDQARHEPLGAGPVVGGLHMPESVAADAVHAHRGVVP